MPSVHILAAFLGLSFSADYQDEPDSEVPPSESEVVLSVEAQLAAALEHLDAALAGLDSTENPEAATRKVRHLLARLGSREAFSDWDVFSSIKNHVDGHVDGRVIGPEQALAYYSILNTRLIDPDETVVLMQTKVVVAPSGPMTPEFREAYYKNPHTTLVEYNAQRHRKEAIGDFVTYLMPSIIVRMVDPDVQFNLYDPKLDRLFGVHQVQAVRRWIELRVQGFGPYNSPPRPE